MKTAVATVLATLSTMALAQVARPAVEQKDQPLANMTPANATSTAPTPTPTATTTARPPASPDTKTEPAAPPR